MLRIDFQLQPADFTSTLHHFFKLSGEKITLIEKTYDRNSGAPVFTSGGRYTTRGWTEWTQGFQYGSAILQFDATGDESFLQIGRSKTLEVMAPHISHTGVHDHGFNNVSTYGNMLRLVKEGKVPYNEWERHFYELALKLSGAVQANRWSVTGNGGFIHSFNGSHSLFVDTIRSCRVLMLSHALGHVLQGENDARVSLWDRAILHMEATAQYSVYYGEGRDSYDEWGRTAHESIFNTKDGNFRCPNSQQGYSGFTTWTRGLAWAMCGFAEQLEWLQSWKLAGRESRLSPGTEALFLRAAKATCDFYIQNTPTDGIPYWDTGAPGLQKLGGYLDNPGDPYNEYEPVDSSAAAIGAQGLLRLGRYLQEKGDRDDGKRYWQAGLTVLRSLFAGPYLSEDPAHEGLILHSVYHRPNGWDHIPPGSKIPNGESSMWGDYHAREVALYLQRIINDDNYYTFYSCVL